MKITRSILLSVCCIGLLLFLAACGPTASQIKSQQTVTIGKSFQSQASPIPTVPAYRCGAWSSNNAPGAYSTIAIYARLTTNITGVAGANATPVVHFKSGDQPLDQQVSDSGGYVSFPLHLQGIQPVGVPATVDVTFTNIPGSHNAVYCTPAFFTPQ